LKKDILEQYTEPATAWSQPSFWDFNALYNTIHDAILTKWVTDDLDLNSSGVEFLAFEPKNHSIRATFRDPVTKIAIPITREVFASIIESVKIQAKYKKPMSLLCM
jgi:hypothetical protein